MILRPYAFALGLALLSRALGQTSGPDIVSRHTLVMERPPSHVPSGTVVDGPIVGNGDLGLVAGGPPELQRFYFGKNDFWSRQRVTMSVGGLELRMPELAGATYRQEQDMRNAELRGTFAKGDRTLRTRSWVSANENLEITELSLEGALPLPVSAKLFPGPTRLRENDKPVNIGREQSGSGRWYFDGLIDEVQLFGRALREEEVQSLARLAPIKQGLVRNWSFDSRGVGGAPDEAKAQIVNGRDCPGAGPIWRSVEVPDPEPAGCRPEGSNDYRTRSLGKQGFAVQVSHGWNYVDAGPVPRLEQVTVAAWVYIFTTGDANYILSKGEWNEAYNLSLDHGRLRFNVGERFVRSSQPLPVHQWVHLAGTFDGAILRAFVDGSEVQPPARYLIGGASGDQLWLTRNADGPLDEQYGWPNPLPPTRTPTTKGREVTVATRLLGEEARAVDDGLEFNLRPGGKVWLVTAVLSDIDAPQHLESARSRVSTVTPAEIEKLNAAHREWWTRFWSESYVEIGDSLIEKFYYASHYLMASASRTGKVAPGLYTPWVTTDHAGWNGDYTLNYNFETPFLALYSSNHIATTDSYDAPVLDFIGRAKLYAGTMLNVRGVYYPAHIGPWGIERDTDHDPFMGQKSDAAFLAIPMLLRIYHTWDESYTRTVYPFLLEVATFWEDFLKYENGRYVIRGASENEVYTSLDNYVNSMRTLGFVRALFRGLVAVSAELGRDAERRVRWQHIVDRLSAFPTQERNGKTVFRCAESGESGMCYRHIWPAGQIGLSSDPKLLEVARNTVDAIGYSTHPLFAPVLPRIGYDPSVILENLRQHCQDHGYPNGYIFYNGGGIETASTVPATINEMLLQSHEGVLRLFPVWPKDKDARFGNLRAYGAFLVSSEWSKGRVQALRIESEKGRACTLQNPWPGRGVVLYRNGRKGERLSGDTFTFKTIPGEQIEARPL
jgi:hypothetical protein